MASHPGARLREGGRGDRHQGVEKFAQHWAHLPDVFQAGNASHHERQRAGHRHELVLGTGPAAHAGPLAEQHHPDHRGQLPRPGQPAGAGSVEEPDGADCQWDFWPS
uniref:(northern house mosquito) hypothetical protein n=1 Tax=Culex pipiens TaxID=7175 RepID=A0A8D8BTF9_CULPI